MRIGIGSCGLAALLTVVAAAQGRVQTVEIDGARLDYLDEGERSGAPMLFLNADTMDLRQWDAQAELFARQQRVVRMNPRTPARAAQAARGFSPAGDAYALMLTLDVTRAVVVGAGAGAAAAVDLALAHPDRVAALVLASPAIDGYSWSSEYRARYEVFAAARGGARVDALLRDPHIAPSAHGDRRVRERVRRLFEAGARTPLGAVAPPGLGARSAVERLGEIRVPTLVIVGALDHADVHAVADFLTSRLSGSRRATLDGVGHLAHVERPDGFTLLVRVFLRDVLRPAPPAGDRQAPGLRPQVSGPRSQAPGPRPLLTRQAFSANDDRETP